MADTSKVHHVYSKEFIMRDYNSSFLVREASGCQLCLDLIIWGGWVNQAYSRLSTTHGHITDCKLDSVLYAGVCVVI